MDLDLSDDQVALRDGIASMLTARVPMERVRNGFDRALFDDLAEAGVFSLRADGFSWSDCVVVFEQLGRFCVPGPLVASLLFGDGAIAGITSASPPIWIEHLDALDVLVATNGEPRLRAINPKSVEAERSPWPLDPCTPVARAQELPAGTPFEIEYRWDLAGATLTAALQLGLADRLTELAVDYAKERVQFDKPIGSFQAVQHLCADMLRALELGRAAGYYACWAADDADPAEAHRAATMAKAFASNAYAQLGGTAIQVFGGIGFTWEHDIHLYYKRLLSLSVALGSSSEHLAELARIAID
jgi:alkylation response protein AidB-like acyl-CoA dehydrogenase